MRIQKLGLALFFLTSIALCIRNISEPDLWWQLRTGQYIIENGYVPQVDVFSYSYEGEPWVNVKWGIEVIMAFFYSVFGFSGIPILQVTFLIGTLFFLWRSSILTSELFGQKTKSTWALLLALELFLLLASYRLAGRPEMVSYFFTSSFFWIIISNLKKYKWTLYLLIPLQILWANMHEGYGVGLVMIILFIIASVIKALFAKSLFPSKSILILVGVSILMWLGTSVHPAGITMLSYFFNLFIQLEQNQFTTEMSSVLSSNYWNFSAFVMLILMAISIHYILRHFNSIGILNIKGIIDSLHPVFLLLFFAFLTLGLISNRNLIFFGIVSTPFIYTSFNHFFRQKWSLKAFYLISISLLYFSIGSNWFYQNIIGKGRYGIEIDAETTPIGASDFIKENFKGQKGFVDYLSSSYFLFSLQPNFKSYVDLRDLDVFDESFIQNIMVAMTYPDARTKSGKTLFHFMESVDSFEYAVIVNKHEFKPILKYLHTKDSTWTLAYADLITSVFIKNSKSNKRLFNEAKRKPLEQIYSFPKQASNPEWYKLVSRIFWPLYQERKFTKRQIDKTFIIYQNMIR